jgi:outer membrane protein OmpA-like peptidoglycan-associated protein
MKTMFPHALFFVLLLPVVSRAQSGDMVASGKVIDARTHKGIRATVRYSSLPTGSISGKFVDSVYSFSIFGTARYQITAEATGYNPKTIVINPKEIGSDHKLVSEIKLMPSGETIVLNHLIFQQGKSEIDPRSFKELDEISMMMKDNAKMVIQLEGHTDNVGSSDANMALSKERVEAVKKYIIKTGVKGDRIKTKAFGGTKPLRNEQTPEARALNRRVEMRILKD